MTSIKYQILFSDSFVFRKMGGDFWEGCSYFGTELSVGLDPLLFNLFVSFIFQMFFFSNGSSFVGDGRNNLGTRLAVRLDS